MVRRNGANVDAYPSSLLFGAVGVSIQTGEHGARRHEFTGLVPAVGVAKARSISLALAVEDGVQPARMRGQG